MWPSSKNGEKPPKFIMIVALHSELIAVSTSGHLYQWRWNDPMPYFNADNPSQHHPKSERLNLASERVVDISASTVRCSVLTLSGKVATFVDETLGEVGAKMLEQSATPVAEGSTETLISVHTCPLYSCVRAASGALFWWGVLPFSHRSSLWDKYVNKTRKQRLQIVPGVMVSMRSSPMYQAGAVGFCISGGVPKVGQLVNAAWSLSHVCRFKILPVANLNSSNNGNQGGAGSSSSQSTGSASQCDKKTGTGSSKDQSVGGCGASSSSSEPPPAKLRKTGSTSSVVGGGPSLASTSGNLPGSSCGGSSSSSGVSSGTPGGGADETDKLDMPPPPSPASSTCSDSGELK